MRTRSLVVPLVVALVATAFAGCLQSQTSNEATISRIHTMTLSRDTTSRASEHEDDAMAALRELLHTDLVVRVEDAGDYTLEYTDAQGNAKTQTLTGAQPGTPVTVSGVDPLAPAVLKRGTDTIIVRSGVSGLWWHAGDMPLGFNLTDSAKTVYDFKSRVQESLTLRDVNVEQQNLVLDNVLFDLNLPIEGTASWELQQDTGDGSPVLVNAELHIPSAAGDLVTLDVKATQEGKPGTAGAIGGVSDAKASASAKFWVKNGQPVATQFLGGQAKATPKVTMWADGFFADLAGDTSCSGKSKADACQPTEIESFDESQPAMDKETITADDLPKSTDDGAREAISMLESLFAQDIQRGDKVNVVAIADSQDFGMTSSPDQTGSARMEFTLEAVGIEDVSVPAGKFSAIKLVEETRTKVNLNNVPGPEGTTAIKSLGLDETVARTTFWLDARTYQPLKMTAETPFDADKVLKSVLDSIDPSVWDQAGSEPLRDDQWTVKAVAESSYEAREVRPGSHFSALVGLGLAHVVTGTFAASPAMWATSSLTGFGQSSSSQAIECIPAPAPENGTEDMGASPPCYPHSSPYPVTPEGRPGSAPGSLSITSAGPITDGVKTFNVASASKGLSWGQLVITVDDEESYLFVSEDGMCMPPEAGSGSFSACRKDVAISYDDFVQAGDELLVLADAGAELRVIDAYSNTVMIVLKVS